MNSAHLGDHEELGHTDVGRALWAPQHWRGQLHRPLTFSSTGVIFGAQSGASPVQVFAGTKGGSDTCWQSSSEYMLTRVCLGP